MIGDRGGERRSAALVIAHVLDEIATQVSLGRVVRLPGFGVFGPWLWQPKNGGDTPVYPRFIAARPFRNQVRAVCRYDQAKNETLSQFQRSHHPSSRPDKVGSRTYTAMRAWREQMLRDAGYDVCGGNE